MILFGFKYFFLGAIIKPLNKLEKGITEVQKGNLQIKVPISVEDEIGFITRNFNTMVDKISSSEKELADYANNLEKKVEERTTELSESNEKLKTAMDALWGEMELAKKIQTALIPTNPKIIGYDISAYMLPADEVGGDYYDIINVDGRDWIIIGDVSGHGVPAGLIMMMVQTSIHSVLSHNPEMDPSKLINFVNKTIYENIQKLGENKYMTLTVLACVENGVFHFSGLHQDILVYRKNSGQVESVETDGIWLGVVDNIDNMNADHSLTLQPGDTLLLYTDGITESSLISNVESSEYGEEKLFNVFKSCGSLTAKDIKLSILSSLKEYKQKDDISMVIIKRD